MDTGARGFLNRLHGDPELRRTLTGLDLTEILEVVRERGYTFSRDELRDALREEFQPSDEPGVILPLGE